MQTSSIYVDKDPSYFSHSRPEILQFIPKATYQKKLKALDVGCGMGYFGALLKSERGFEVWGIEPDINSIEYAKGNLDNVINGFFDENIQELKSQKFDYIFFNDVLEHLIDPEAALQTAKKYLTENGSIIASIPNIRWYPVILSLIRYKDFKYEVSGVMDKTHLRFFTRKSMVRLFEANGYSVINIKGINKHTHFKIFNIINFLLFKTQEDMKFPQFLIIAKPK